MSHKPSTNTVITTDALIEQCRLTVDSPKPGRAYAQLLQLVERILVAQGDQTILQAINRLDAMNDRSLADLLESNADEVSSAAPVSLQLKDGLTSDCTLRLWALPVLLETRPGMTTPDTVSEPLCAEIARSFRRHGLISGEATVVLSPLLYTLNNFPVDWCDRRELLRQFGDQLNAGTSGIAVDIAAPAIPSRRSSGIVLRFLVMAVTTLNDEPPGLLAADWDTPLEVLDNPQSTADAVRLDAWRGEMAAVLKRIDGIHASTCGVPGSFTDAIYSGTLMDNVARLDAAITQASDAKTGTDDITACVSVHRTDSGAINIRIGILGPGGFYGSAWRCWSSPEDIDTDIEDVKTTLEGLGVERTTVDPNIRGDDRCPDCGEPMFPSESGAHHPASHHPATVH